MVLFNHPTKDFAVQTNDRVAQLILERIKTPQVKKMATLPHTDRGASGFGSTGVKPIVQASQQEDKKGEKKKVLHPHYQVHNNGKRKTW